MNAFLREDNVGRISGSEKHFCFPVLEVIGLSATSLCCD
jgi:hypothetical protein